MASEIGSLTGTCTFRRASISEGNPWFRGKDVATSLGYKDQRRTLYRHVRPKHKTTLEDLLLKVRANQPNHGQNQPPLANQQSHELYVNEPGLYSLIFRSKLPKAEAFTDWVTEEVCRQLGGPVDMFMGIRRSPMIPPKCPPKTGRRWRSSLRSW